LDKESQISGIPDDEEIASPAKGRLARNDKYPLQAIGHHTLQRVHSTHANNDWLEEAFPQRVFINPIDAAARGISDGNEVKVYNERGALVLPCRITLRIMPGVVDIPQGAWWQPDENGMDHGGNVNVLTSARWTPFAFGSAQHTIMVEVEKFPHTIFKRNKGSRSVRTRR
jgi:anaerobic dimethyl sulfoxide reductase subunit A